MNAFLCVAVVAAAIVSSLAQTRPPPDPCRTCQIIINIARHHFNNTVNDQGALQTQLLSECDRLAMFEGQAAADACKQIVNTNIVTIYNDMHTDKSALQTCQDIQECPATKEKQHRRLRRQMHDPCATCEIIIGIAKRHFHNMFNNQSALQAQLIYECQQLAMHGYSDSEVQNCITIINNNMPAIYNELVNNPNANPHQVCRDLGECQMKALKRQRRQTHDPCRTCEIIIGIAKRHFNNMFTNETALLIQLLAECDQLGMHGFSPDEVRGCRNVVTTNIDAIYTELSNNPNADPHKICQDFRECPMKMQKRQKRQRPADPCRICDIIMNIARHHFNNTVNDQMGLQTQLLAECTRVGQIEGNAAGDHCTMIVNNNIAKIYNDLHTNMTPRQTCQDIGECPQGPLSPQQVFNSRRQ